MFVHHATIWKQYQPINNVITWKLKSWIMVTPMNSTQNINVIVVQKHGLLSSRGHPKNVENNMITNTEVYFDGEQVDSWACDIDPETGEMQSNGGVEHVISYKDKHYRVITSWDGETIYNPDGKAKTIKWED